MIQGKMPTVYVVHANGVIGIGYIRIAGVVDEDQIKKIGLQNAGVTRRNLSHNEYALCVASTKDPIELQKVSIAILDEAERTGAVPREELLLNAKNDAAEERVIRGALRLEEDTVASDRRPALHSMVPPKRLKTDFLGHSQNKISGCWRDASFVAQGPADRHLTNTALAGDEG